MPIIIPCFTCFGDQDPVRDALAGTLQSKVGELFSVLWDWTLGWPTNLILLSQNAELLDKEMKELEEMRNDMKRRVEYEEAQPSMERMDEMKGWMAMVGEHEVQVSGFQAARERQSIWITGFCLGRTAVELLKRVRLLTSQLSNLNTVVGPAAPNADLLSEEMKELRILRDDLMRSVRIKEADPQMKRTHLVKEWVEMVDDLDAEVVEFLRSQSPGYTELAKKLLRQVRKLKSQGNFDSKEVVSQVPPDAVEAVPSKPVSSIVGGEETLSEIRGHLRNEQVGIIGVYGMGGVGKTTILKQINNELCAAGTHGGMFDVVIMITVSSVQNKLAMQKDIGERIGLTLAEDGGGAGNSSRLVKDQARTLSKALSRKRFLLLLDDVWEQLVLEDIGVPAPGSTDNMCKVVFTTRSEEVCIDMGAHEKVKVNPLSEGQPWELFRRTVRADAILDNPSIRPLAEKVVTQCGGLPLALITVGRAMANKELPQEWSAAVKALEDNAQELRGMKDRVLESLKFSFDWLQTDTLRCCLLYCSLFPEDFEIDREQLVEYWIGEGFTDVGESTSDADMDRARGRGHTLITELQAACLLERGKSDETNRVKLHDTVRDMALWLTSGSVQGYNKKFLVHAGKGPEAPLPGTERWGDATRISFMHNWKLILPSSIPYCPSAETMLMNGNPGITVGVYDALFTSLPMLRVLDLSHMGIDELPASIGLLVHLQYLNISLTKIVSLSKELGKLVNLRQLVMRWTSILRRIPLEAFLPLSRLQSLDMYRSDYSWRWELSESDAEQQRGACLRDLERLDGLSELGLDINTSDCLNGLLSSPRLTRSTRFLSLSMVHGHTPSGLQAALSSMEKLQELRLMNCKQIEELRFTADQLQSLGSLELWFLPLSRVVVDGEAPLRCLRRLEIMGCYSLRHITWAGRLPCIKSIDVSFCNSMEELLAGDEVEGRAFPTLRMMNLGNLPMLKSIAPRPLPSLESLNVYDCPELKKLPFGASSAERIKLISGEQEWWDGLQWEDQNVKEQLLPHFVDQ